MSDLTILVPTRGRPGNLRALWQAFTETCIADTALIALIDSDDPEQEAYWRVRDEIGDEPLFRMASGPRLRLGGTLNVAAPSAAARCRAIGFMGDDHRPRTVGWDERYLQELERLGTGIVYGNDLIQGANLPTEMAMTSGVVLATGYLVPPGMTHLWIDNAWKALGEALGALSYLPDVVVEHMHPLAGKAPSDQGYIDCNTDALSDADRAVFEQWRANDLPLWVEKIREYPRG